MTDITPPQNDEAEVAVLGTVLLANAALSGLLAVEGLRPDHFYRPRHRAIFTAMTGLADKGEPVDAVTLCAELERHRLLEEAGGNAYVHSLPTMVPSAGAVRDYARIVIADAGFRAQLDAGRALMQAAAVRDADGVAGAESALAGGARVAGTLRKVSRLERQEAVAALVESGGGRIWKTPFLRVNELFAGGFRPGQFTTLGGWPSHGKSALMVQMLEHFAEQGARCALYSNEMESQEIDGRDVSRASGISYWRLVQGQVKDDEQGKFLKAIEALGTGYELIEAAGATADEIAYDIRRERWDVAVIDLLNGLPNSSETKDIDHNVNTLAACSRQASCHIVGLQHLNQSRNVGHAYPPEPSVSDLRGSGSMWNLSNNVLFVYREESETEPGLEGDESIIKVAKARGGLKGRADVVFEGRRMRFRAAAQPGTVGGIA
ncbi:MAG TPA: replicative DNA helicase [Thermoleophilaceae bacterium]|nr:replicative DNA helicase [Thermoleophilaceae bacterium]